MGLGYNDRRENELERKILKEKLRSKPNYKFIRWLQQLNLKDFLKSKKKK